MQQLPSGQSSLLFKTSQFPSGEDKQHPLHYEHGFFQGAIQACEIAGHDARRSGLCTIDTLHDAINAFASTTLAAHAETISSHLAPPDHPMTISFIQRQRSVLTSWHRMVCSRYARRRWEILWETSVSLDLSPSRAGDPCCGTLRGGF